MRKWKRKLRSLKQKIYLSLMPDDDFRRIFLMRNIGYGEPDYTIPGIGKIETLKAEVILDQKQHDFLASKQGQQKYDAVYGLIRQMADQLKPFSGYTETFNHDTGEWTHAVTLKVIK